MVTLVLPDSGVGTRATGFLDELYRLLSEGLSGASATLSGTAGMGGRVVDFTASYDEVAGPLLPTGCDLAGAVANLRLMIAAAFDNYVRAETAATLAPAHVGVVPPTPSAPYPFVEGAPSSVGDNGGDPWVWPVLEKSHAAPQWPDLDTGKIRTAASAWGALAAAYQRGSAYLDCAVAELDDYRAPDLLVAGAVLDSLGTQLIAYADQCSSLASSLTTIAATTDAAVSQMREKCNHAEIEAGAGTAAAVVAGALTIWAGGAGGAATDAAVDAVLAGTVGVTIADLALDLLATLAEFGEGFAAILPVLRNCEVIASGILEAKSVVAVVDDLEDAISIDDSLDLAVGRDYPRLTLSELQGLENTTNTHVIKRHVRQTLDQLADRLERKPNLPAASTFPDEATALLCINDGLRRNQSDVRKWVASKTARGLEIEGRMDHEVGIVMKRSGDVSTTDRYRLFLIPDDSQEFGFRILTAYPITR